MPLCWPRLAGLWKTQVAGALASCYFSYRPGVAELADAADSKSAGALLCVGSTPSSGTTFQIPHDVHGPEDRLQNAESLADYHNGHALSYRTAGARSHRSSHRWSLQVLYSIECSYPVGAKTHIESRCGIRCDEPTYRGRACIQVWRTDCTSLECRRC